MKIICVVRRQEGSQKIRQCSKRYFWCGRQDEGPLGRRQQDKGRTAHSWACQGCLQGDPHEITQRSTPLTVSLHWLSFLSGIHSNSLIFKGFSVPKMNTLWDRICLGFLLLFLVFWLVVFFWGLVFFGGGACWVF